MKTLFFRKPDENTVECGMCSHFCKIEEGKKGICGVRQNNDGVLESLVYDKVVARSIDPIEKKPLYHVKPGSLSYSVATMGCNFKCAFCQNADIAQMPAEQGTIRGVAISPEEIVAQAVRGKCDSIAYTYTEPTVYFELAFETARLASERGLLNVFVTNGFMSQKVIETVAPYLNAANVDLKSFHDKFYQKYCKGRAEPVKENLKLMHRLGILLEVTTLLIPGLNDSSEELEQIAAFIAEQLGREVPWHISRFHPCHHMTDRGRTPLDSLKTAFGKGKEAGLYHVYAGNAPEMGLENTHCHACGALLVKRYAYNTEAYIGSDGKCPECGTDIYGIF